MPVAMTKAKWPGGKRASQPWRPPGTTAGLAFIAAISAPTSATFASLGGKEELQNASAGSDSPLRSLVACRNLPRAHPFANQFIEHLLGPVLGLARLVQITEGGDDL